MISLENIFFSYAQKEIFNSFNYKFDPGIHYIQGQNGSGKSTLLSLISGEFDRSFYQGDITIDGENIHQNLNKKRIFLPDNPSFYPNFSCLDLMKLVCKLRESSLDACLEQAEKYFEISTFLHQPLRLLSLGQKKKIFLSVSTFQNISYWVFDEPFNGLDEKSIQSLTNLILNHSLNGATIILSSHIQLRLDANQYKVLRIS